jgi:hypothetical protein
MNISQGHSEEIRPSWSPHDGVRAYGSKKIHIIRHSQGDCQILLPASRTGKYRRITPVLYASGRNDMPGGTITVARCRFQNDLGD